MGENRGNGYVPPEVLTLPRGAKLLLEKVAPYDHVKEQYKIYVDGVQLPNELFTKQQIKDIEDQIESGKVSSITELVDYMIFQYRS